MADYINNIQAADRYSDALTLGINPRARAATITVAANPALVQFAVGTVGTAHWLDEREWDAVSGPNIINSFSVRNICGVRFRNAIAGQKAQILCTLFNDGTPYNPDNDDPIFESGLLSAGSISANGLVTGTTMITGRVSGAGAILAGSGFTVVRTGTGQYTVNFTNPFAAVPLILCQAEASVNGIRVLTVSASQFTIDCYQTNTLADTDTQFFFAAIPMV